jgi:hypothetical protein
MFIHAASTLVWEAAGLKGEFVKPSFGDLSLLEIGLKRDCENKRGGLKNAVR